GLRLRTKGMNEIFGRFPVVKRRAGTSEPFLTSFGKSTREASVICVREFFPDTLAAAIRQKSRWIIGIAYQGLKTRGWTRDPTLTYFLWRDRKGAISNFVSFRTTLVLLELIALWLYQTLDSDSYRFISIFEGGPWVTALLAANLLLMMNRMAQRVFF